MKYEQDNAWQKTKTCSRSPCEMDAFPIARVGEDFPGEGVLPATTSSFPTGKGARPALCVGSARWWLLLPAPVLQHVVVPSTEERKDRHVEWQGFPALKSQRDALQSCGSVCASSLCAHPYHLHHGHHRRLPLLSLFHLLMRMNARPPQGP